MTTYLYARHIRIFDYTQFAQPIREGLSEHAKRLAAEAGTDGVSKRSVLAATGYVGGTNRLNSSYRGDRLPSTKTLRAIRGAINASYVEVVGRFDYYHEIIRILDDLVWLGPRWVEEDEARGEPLGPQWRRVQRRTVASSRVVHGRARTKILNRLYLRGMSSAVALIWLAGCGGSQPPIGAPNPILPAADNIGDHSTSWMARDAAKKDLVYISDARTGYVTVLSYPDGKVVGQIKGLKAPEGECSDAKGNVWIVLAGSEIVEYAHGGTKQIGALQDPGQPYSCAIDPVSGDLAVTNFYGPTYSYGYVAVYPKAQGSLKIYIQHGLFQNMFFCGYGTKGNLFADGGDEGFFGFSMLRSGHARFHYVSVADLRAGNNVQFDGSHWAIGVPGYARSSTNAAIYQVQTRPRYHDTIIGTTQLLRSTGIAQFSIGGGYVVGADDSMKDVGFWKYPAGGEPTKIIRSGFVERFGTAISLAISTPRLRREAARKGGSGGLGRLRALM